MSKLLEIQVSRSLAQMTRANGDVGLRKRIRVPALLTLAVHFIFSLSSIEQKAVKIGRQYFVVENQKREAHGFLKNMAVRSCNFVLSLCLGNCEALGDYSSRVYMLEKRASGIGHRFGLDARRASSNPGKAGKLVV